MKLIHGILGTFVIAIAWLCWNTLNLAIENDGLKQMSDSQRRSIEVLLNYASAAARCDITPEELAAILKMRVETSPDIKNQAEVAHLEFKAQFVKGRLSSVEIVDVGKVMVCQTH